MLAVLLSLSLAQATVYVWVDKAGVEHFTDDPGSIPKGAKVRTTEGVTVSRIDSDVVKNPPRSTTRAEEEPPVPGRSEEEWRRLFKEARRKVTTLEEDIEADRKKVEEVNGLPVNAQFNCMGGYWGPGVTMGTVGGYGGVGLTATGQLGPALSVTGTAVGTTVVRPGTTYVNPCIFVLNPEVERVRERLASNRRELVRAKEDLADLERRAAFAAVPLHWRR